jgi:hypothetical protein
MSLAYSPANNVLYPRRAMKLPSINWAISHDKEKTNEYQYEG